jgi:hypothetical protein
VIVPTGKTFGLPAIARFDPPGVARTIVKVSSQIGFERFMTRISNS